MFAMNVLEVLTVTTILYFAAVALWIVKLEDLLTNRNRTAERSGGER